MFYDIDIYRWAWLLLPPVLRRTRLYALLCVLLLPVHQMLNSFRSYRESAIRRVNVNGQVIYVEKALNDAKDEIGGMAMAIASKVVEREISEADHKALIDSFIENVGDAS